jgi:NADP-dependent 3-hydroxy acid dehydrogenase YdfG
METISYKTALIVGAGTGLSAALTRLFTRKNIFVALAAR